MCVNFFSSLFFPVFSFGSVSYQDFISALGVLPWAAMVSRISVDSSQGGERWRTLYQEKVMMKQFPFVNTEP